MGNCFFFTPINRYRMTNYNYNPTYNYSFRAPPCSHTPFFWNGCGFFFGFAEAKCVHHFGTFGCCWRDPGIGRSWRCLLFLGWKYPQIFTPKLQIKKKVPQLGCRWILLKNYVKWIPSSMEDWEHHISFGGGFEPYDESSKVVVHFPCLGCLQIIVWMCVFLLF